MGPYGSKFLKRHPSYESQPKDLKLLLNFSPNGHHQNTFGFFEILKFERCVFIFVTVGPNGNKKIQSASPANSRSQKFSNLSGIILPMAMGLAKHFVFFLNFEYPIEHILPYGETKNLNCLENQVS